VRIAIVDSARWAKIESVSDEVSAEVYRSARVMQNDGENHGK